MVYDFR